MTDQKTSLRDDIAYMRDLAQAGASAPLVGGHISIFFGSFYALISVIHWPLMNYVKPESWVYSTMWLASWVVSWAVWWVMTGKLIKQPGAQSPTNKAAGRAWMAVGFGMAAMFFSIFIVCWRLDSSQPYAVIPSIIVALYGSAWFVGASMSGQKWMWLPTSGSFAYALVLAFFITSPYLYLIFALGLILLGVLPGIMIVRREPSLIV